MVKTQQETINTMYEMLMHLNLNIHNVQTFYEKPSHFTATPVAQAGEGLKNLYRIYREGTIYKRYCKSKKYAFYWLPKDGDVEVVGGWKASELAYKDWNVVYISKAFIKPLNEFIALLREEGYELTFKLGCLPNEFTVGLDGIKYHSWGRAVDIGINKPMTEEVMKRITEKLIPLRLIIKIYHDWIHICLGTRGYYKFYDNRINHSCIRNHNFPAV